eukprot:3677609-Pleurochrysis_carterae.AAC.1
MAFAGQVEVRVDTPAQHSAHKHRVCERESKGQICKAVEPYRTAASLLQNTAWRSTAAQPRKRQARRT